MDQSNTNLSQLEWLQKSNLENGDGDLFKSQKGATIMKIMNHDLAGGLSDFQKEVSSDF